jgi:hypothetical protein
MRQRETPGSPKFIEPEDRIAAFDQDGTTWVEQPSYAQVMFALGVPELLEVVTVTHSWRKLSGAVGTWSA